jgi:nucleoside-diphosphate-sugar epimerase
MRILVTGGLGFVGIHLVRWLAEHVPAAYVIAGDVTPLDEMHETYLEPVRNKVGVVELDVCDRSALKKLMDEAEVEVVIHAAAITADDQEEREKFSQVLDVNLAGSVNAISAAAAVPSVSRFLFISSNGVYGAVPPGSGLISEDHPLSLNILYTITKHAIELVLERCKQLTGKQMASARISAIYGEMEYVTGSRSRTSQVHRLGLALKNGQQVKVCGAQVSRDWMYAEDCAEAVRSLILAPVWKYPVYNVGCGGPLSFGQIVEAFVRRGLQAEWVEDWQQAEIFMKPEQARAVLDIQKLRKGTGFTLQMEPLNRLEYFLDRLK